MTKERKLLFSVTAKDCDWSFSHGTGNGGQARNKSLSAVHCTHRASGAHAYSQSGRSQEDNKRDAFVKMCNTKEFKDWHRREVWKHLGILDQIERAVADGMRPENLRMEIRVDGKWVEVPLDAPLDIDPDQLTAGTPQ
jgi:protein subunit release factor A